MNLINQFLHAAWWPSLFFAFNWVVIVLAVFAYQKDVRKNWRFLAAAIMSAIGWFSMVFFSRIWLIGTPPLFVVDLLGAVVYYFLSVPRVEKNGEIIRHDWAVIGFCFYLSMAILEFLGFIRSSHFVGQIFLFSVAGGLWLFIFVGFVRGFDKISISLFLVVSTIFVLLSIFSYALALNITTLLFDFFLIWVMSRSILIGERTTSSH